MKATALLILGLAAMATARPEVDDHTIVSTDIKQRQTLILKLLNHVMEPCMYKDIVDIGKNFKIEENVDLYTKSDVVKRFLNLLKIGVLPRGEVFTIHIDRQLDEVVTMFHMLHYAKDFTTFIKTACWMRLHMNEGMFVYALTVACRHREDCRGIILPPPYEIYPYYFVRADVIQKAYMLKMKKGLLDHKLCDFYGIKKTDKDVFIIDENVFDKRVYLNHEDKLRYFTEDIDLNTYYFYFHADYPFWMRDTIFDKFKVRRCELTLYIYQQILARYYLERLSNGLGEIKTLSWNKPIRKGYWPWLKLHNGIQLPNRFNNYVVVRDDNINAVRLAETYEMIIKEAIVKGYIEINGMRLELTKTDDIETLGKLIYGKIEKRDMSTTTTTETEAYRYLLIIMKAKRLVNLVALFKKRLPCYTKEELLFPGVKIDNVVVDKLVTYFDDYLMDMTNAVILNEEEIKKTKSDMTFLVRKRRLNHQPFKVTLDVISDKAVDCVIRIFLGPKEDHLNRLIDINHNRLNFVELDSFLHKLKSGKNTIVRTSTDMHNLVRDRIMTRDLWKKVDTITDIRDLFIKDLRNYMTGFPTRLLLPRGKVGGMKMMIYCIVTPLRLVENIDMNLLDTNRKDLTMDFRSTTLLDKMPLGFPLDRHIDVTKFFTPNMKFVDVTIFHKKMVCDMKTRWNKYVLKHYDMVDWTENDKQLPKGEIFTELNQDHMYELKLVYEILYNAPNFDTFYKAACWTRQNANCGLFVNAIYLAILKRRDTENITVPAPYELLPNYFIRRDVIIKASSLLAGGDIPTEGVLNEGNAYILDANYTTNIDADDDSKLAYFHEDIGLNSYYFLKRLQYASWFLYNQVEYSNYGEYLYHFLKQLVARYNLERYSNGLIYLEKVDWKTCRVAPYDSMLIFSNGEEFSYRGPAFDSNSPINTVIQNIEDTISSVIPPMVENGDTKTNIINNLMAILVSNSENYEFETRSYFGEVTDENRLILPGEFAMKKNLFMLLDNFEVNLKIGSNAISRTSSEFENISEDFTSLNDLRKVIEDAEFGLDVKPLKPIKTLTGFPSRLILPKGTPEGLSMQLLAFVAPFAKVTAAGMTSLPKKEFNSAILAPGYPFDLGFDDTQFLALPNVMIKDIIVTHKENKGGSKGGSEGTKKWFGGDTSDSYGPSREPYAANLKNSEFEEVSGSNGVKREVFDYNLRKSQYGKTSDSYGAKREPYDYNLRKSQYGKSEDYAGKRSSYYKGDKDIITDKISVTEKDKLENKENVNTNVVGKDDVILDNIPVSENKDEDINPTLNVGDLSEVPEADNYHNRQFLPNMVLDNAYLNKDDYLLPSVYTVDYIYE
ncbi:hypothetical protein MSG28_013176 [Choristoneura fumiferana]|uniref:Uncharacterized protein n=1 Tax=Choristoneura fumiferana TaxID=7141 RepID=A0ACC0KS55_CHOFU|nr:hypothetical protein MSG28_013176 [Choristoneura fumiferana]